MGEEGDYLSLHCHYQNDVSIKIRWEGGRAVGGGGEWGVEGGGREGYGSPQ